jgi:hypothetical protein
MDFMYNVALGGIVIYFGGRVIISVFIGFFQGFSELIGINKHNKVGLNSFEKFDAFNRLNKK